MKHDFFSVPDRSKFGSSKWNIAKNASTEFVPLSVADMEFPTAKPIVDGIKKLADEAILGYTVPTDAYNDAVISWMKRRHDFEIKKEWMLQTPGIINALKLLIESVTNPGDGVIIMPPVYYPFDMTVVASGRHIVYCPLINENDSYRIDYDLLEKLAGNEKNSAILFCNPHNPIGKVWSADELKRVADICCDNGVFIIDDEIHNDLIMAGNTHTVMAKVSEKAMQNIAVCTAPSKTFNLAGLQCSNIIIPNDDIRSKAQAHNLMNMQMHLNVFAYTACTCAYNECEDWLDELLGVIAENAKCVEDFMAENFPEIKVYPLEGTYLQWLDVRGLGLNHIEMKKLLEDANIYLDNGEMFGPLGRGFQRINLACAKVTIEKMLVRFKNAAQKIRAERNANGVPYHCTLTPGVNLSEFKNSLVIFSRGLECGITKNLLENIKKAYSDITLNGRKISFIVPNTTESIAAVQKNYPFEIIADPEAKIYDKYNVFEADSAISMIAGDKAFEAAVDGDMNTLIETKIFAPAEIPGKRPLQLFAFALTDENADVTYAHYSKTLFDLPDLNGELI